jgi:hypothetical protein
MEIGKKYFPNKGAKPANILRIKEPIIVAMKCLLHPYRHWDNGSVSF